MIDEKIIQEIENVFGQKIRYPKDCEILAVEISSKTGTSISSSTLKRIFGLIKTNSQPNLYTLDTIARYINYKNWDEVQKSLNVTENKETNSGTPKKVNVKIIVAITLIFFVVITAVYFISINDFSTDNKESDKSQEYFWVTFDSLPEVRSGGRAFIHNDKLFYFGGADAEFTRKNNWQFDFKNKKWLAGTSMLMPVAESAMGIVDNKLYSFGGWLGNDIGMADFVQVYDFKTEKWDSLTRMPFASTGMAGVVSGDDIYIFCGSVGETDIHFLKYNIKSNTYDSLPVFDDKRMSGSAVLFKNKIYYLGGISFLNGEYKWRSSVDVFDISTKKWSKFIDLPFKSSHNAALIYKNNIHVMGGTSKYGYVNDGPLKLHYSFDFNKNKWIREYDLPIGLSSHQVLEYKNDLFVIGGNNEFPNPSKNIYKLSEN